MKRVFLFVIILLALLQHRLWFGDNCLPEYFSLKQQIKEQTLANNELKARNQIFKEEIYDLRQGTEALEERARNELGLIKKDETFFRIVNRSQQDLPSSNGAF